MPEVTEIPHNISHIHIMGIGGTAMAALAGLLVDAGYRVTGSDGNIVYPPMSDVLADLGISPMVGYEASNLNSNPELVIVGNVIRSIYPEAKALLSSEIPYMSFPALMGSRFLARSRNIVVAGTHGKTTTTSIAAWLMEACGRKPGFLIGGAVGNFNRTARAATDTEHGQFFAIEGDEYDTAFFDKGPKFLHYRPTTAILTSVEFDHADIYRDLEHCQEAFKRLTASLPEDGCLVARWDHDSVIECCLDCPSEIRRYGKGQEWDGRIDSMDTATGQMTFTVLRNGAPYGTFSSPMVGEHNLYNQVAIVAALDFNGFTASELSQGFPTFKGIRRRQEIVGTVSEITVIDDFAHHPTAIDVTLSALKLRFGGRRMWAIFEPRSATSRRNTFQCEFAQSFSAADIVVIAPPHNRDALGDDALDVNLLVSELRGRQTEAYCWGEAPNGAEHWSPKEMAATIARTVATNATPGDVIAVLSNGGFGGIHKLLLDEITLQLS